MVENTPETNKRWSCRQNKINRMVCPLKLGEEHRLCTVLYLQSPSGIFHKVKQYINIFLKTLQVEKNQVSTADFFHENYTNSIGMFTQMKAPDGLCKQACPVQILSTLKDSITSTHTGAPQSSEAPPTPSQFLASGFSKHSHFQIPPRIQESTGQC